MRLGNSYEALSIKSLSVFTRVYKEISFKIE